MIVENKNKPKFIAKKSIDSYTPLQLKAIMDKIPITKDITWDKITDSITPIKKGLTK
jgi:hypothetical protein